MLVWWLLAVALRGIVFGGHSFQGEEGQGTRGEGRDVFSAVGSREGPTGLLL